MNEREIIEQLESLIEAWQLDEADLNQTDINAIKQMLDKNKKLKEQLEASEKLRKESMLILGEYRHYTLPTEKQNRENEDIVDKAYNNLILKQDIDKGEWK